MDLVSALQCRKPHQRAAALYSCIRLNLNRRQKSGCCLCDFGTRAFAPGTEDVRALVVRQVGQEPVQENDGGKQRVQVSCSRQRGPQMLHPDLLDLIFQHCGLRERLVLASLCSKELRRRWGNHRRELKQAFAAAQQRSYVLGTSVTVTSIDSLGCYLEFHKGQGSAASEARILGYVAQLCAAGGCSKGLHPQEQHLAGLLRCGWLHRGKAFRMGSGGATHGLLTTTSGRRQEVQAEAEYGSVRLYVADLHSSVWLKDSSPCFYLADLKGVDV